MQEKIEIISRKTCRVCHSGSMYEIISFPRMPLTDEFVTSELLGKEFLADITIYVCRDCHAVQTQHDLDMSGYYDAYHYSAAASPIAATFMQSLAKELIRKYFPESKNIKVLEIGSGDGAQLLAFKQQGCDVLGYEPSSLLTKIARAKGIPTILGLFNKDSVSAVPKQFNEADIILLSYTFDHLPDPVEFMQTIKSVINRAHGVLVIEIHDLEKLFLRGEYCLFEHEHSIYLTRETAQTLMEKECFGVIDFEVVPEALRRANSLIFVASPDSSAFSLMKLPKINLPQFGDLDFYMRQASNIRAGISNLESFVDRVTLDGKRLAGYGAGGRAIMTLAAMANSNKIQYLVDKNPKGVNIFSPKSHIPVYDLDELKRSPVDNILVFSYGYMKEIQEDCRALGYSDEQLHSMVDIMKAT